MSDEAGHPRRHAGRSRITGAGPYDRPLRLVAALGQGGFGITYRARAGRLAREVAINAHLPLTLVVRRHGTAVQPLDPNAVDDVAARATGLSLTEARSPACGTCVRFLEARPAPAAGPSIDRILRPLF